MAREVDRVGERVGAGGALRDRRLVEHAQPHARSVGCRGSGAVPPRRSRRRPARPARAAAPAPAGRSARPSTTGRRACRSATCRRCARTGPTATTGAPPRRGSTRSPSSAPRSTGSASTSCTPARRTPARCRWCSPTAGRARSLEFLDVIGPLTDPPRPAPTRSTSSARRCPGYGFSDKPAEPGWGVERIAARVGGADGRLGYERYGAQGSDWGTSVTTSLGQQDPAHLAGIHLMPPLAPPDPATFDDLTDAERAALDDLAAGEATTPATAQSTRPAADRRLRARRLAGRRCARGSWRSSARGRDARRLDPRPDARRRDALLAARHRRVVGAPVLGELRATVRELLQRHATDRVDVPTGCTVFPQEIPARRRAAGRSGASPTSATGASRRAAATSPRSSSPSAFIEEVRAFFRLVR